MGSNPTLSANYVSDCLTQTELKVYKVTLFARRGAREAEGARLEIVCTPKRCTVGSNPTLSANYENKDLGFDSRVLRNEIPRTPPGPEGSNGSGTLRVPQGCLAIIFYSAGCFCS